MIATIKIPTISRLRDAKYSLIARNVYPIHELPYPINNENKFQLCKFRGYVGIIQSNYWNIYAPKLDDEFILLDNDWIKLYKSDAVQGAILWGKNANPSQIVVIE